ncbi:hypothetical protein FACS1894166_07450 [Bacilli bacterium]|nr:hypothetical protein FACS1894166_07450 [Bacilli bacterium]
MCIQIKIGNQNKTFKNYDSAQEFLAVSKAIAKFRKTKGLVVMTRKEYGKYLD